MSAICADCERPPLVVLVGPTASGKTALALELARSFDLEVISADSRQVYRDLDIGTAKATVEERRQVPHHLLDVVDPDQEFTAADYARLAREAAASVHRRGRLPLVVGGTGLYIRVLCSGLAEAPGADPEFRKELLDEEERGGAGTLHRRLLEVDPGTAERLAPRDRVRIIRALEVFFLTGEPLSRLQARHAFAERPFRTLSLGLSPPREELYRRIDRRTEEMFESGLLQEVQGLLDRGYSPDLKALRTIGYREAIQHLQGGLTLADCLSQVQHRTRRYAKQQRTWFRQDKEIIWVDSFKESARIQELIVNFMQSQRSGHG